MVVLLILRWKYHNDGSRTEQLVSRFLEIDCGRIVFSGHLTQILNAERHTTVWA